MRCKIAKAAYDKARRQIKRDEIRAYDAERNKLRRSDPEYNSAQKDRKDRWREANREKYLASNRAYDRRSIIENPQRRISKNLRHRISKAAKGLVKGGSAVALLGMSVEDFKVYLEGLFCEGMSWNNYGEWHIDHIKPLILFDLSSEDECMTAFNHKNLQPLWASDNMKKGAKYNHEANA